MKKRYIWAGIALLGLLGLLAELFFKKELITLIRGADVAAWYGIEEWSGLTTKQLYPVVLDLAASEEPRKLAFAALLGAILEEKEIEEEAEKSAPMVFDNALSGDTPEDKLKALESAAKSISAYSKKREEIIKNREEEGKQIISQETLDSWQKIALEKAAPDDVLLLNMLATFGLAKSDSAKALQDEAIIRWQQAEPDNLAPLFHQQTLSVQELLEQAKTRDSYQEHHYSISRWMYQTLLPQLPKQQKAITTEIMGLEATATFPNIRTLVDFCKKNPPEHASEKWQLCLSLAQKLREKSSNTVMHLVGILILQTLASSDAEKQILDNEKTHIREMLKQKDDLINGVGIFKNYLQRVQDEAINSELQEVKDFLRKEGFSLKASEENS